MPSRRPSRRPRASKALKSSPRQADTPRGTLLGATELTELRQLIRLVQRTGIGELELSSGGRTVRIAAHASGPMAVAMPAMTPEAREAVRDRKAEHTGNPSTSVETEKSVAITSPMVGTFYRAPAPDADPYVEAGDSVEVGQTVCIVEAMKLMNEIESEVRGRIVQILVENAQPVEFGQKLFLIEPV